MAMLSGYVDESGNDGKSTSLVLGGYVLPAENWLAFSCDWKKVLDNAPRISYFKASQAEYGNGEFAGIDQPLRNAKVLELLAVIEKHVPLGLVCWMRFDSWEEILLPRASPGFDNVYYPVFDWIIKENFNQRKDFECSTDFIFDDDKTNITLKTNLITIHYGIREQVAAIPEFYKMLGSSPAFKDDKIVLQAADLLVWHKRRHLNDPEKRDIYERLWKTVHFARHLDRSYLNAFR